MVCKVAHKPRFTCFGSVAPRLLLCYLYALLRAQQQVDPIGRCYVSPSAGFLGRRGLRVGMRRKRSPVCACRWLEPITLFFNPTNFSADIAELHAPSAAPTSETLSTTIHRALARGRNSTTAAKILNPSTWFPGSLELHHAAQSYDCGSEPGFEEQKNGRGRKKSIKSINSAVGRLTHLAFLRRDTKLH